jgi:hypothetical protein
MADSSFPAFARNMFISLSDVASFLSMGALLKGRAILPSQSIIKCLTHQDATRERAHLFGRRSPEPGFDSDALSAPILVVRLYLGFADSP